MLERGDDPRVGGADASGEVHEGGDATASGPGEPALEGVFAGLAFDGEDVAQALFEEVGAVEAGVGRGDPGELVALVVGEVLGVLPKRVAGVLETARVAGGVAAAAALAERGAVAASVGPWRRASFQAARRTSSSASLAHLTT